MWKRQNDIKGVSAGPIIELKALVFEKSEEAKYAKESGERRVKKVHEVKKGSLVLKHNAGVAEREAKDLEQEQDEEKTTEKAELALKAKAELYSRMEKGEVLQTTKREEDDDSDECMVDFGVKRYEAQTSGETEQELPQKKPSFYADPAPAVKETKKHFHSADVLEGYGDEEEVLGQVLEETRGGREQAIEQKRKRKQAVETRLEAIRKKQQKFKQQKEHEHRQQQYAEKRQQPGIQEDTAKRDS